MGYYTRHELNIVTNVDESVVNEVLNYIVSEDLQYNINEFEGGSVMELDTEPYETERIYSHKNLVNGMGLRKT